MGVADASGTLQQSGLVHVLLTTLQSEGLANGCSSSYIVQGCPLRRCLWLLCARTTVLAAAAAAPSAQPWEGLPAARALYLEEEEEEEALCLEPPPRPPRRRHLRLHRCPQWGASDWLQKPQTSCSVPQAAAAVRPAPVLHRPPLGQAALASLALQQAACSAAAAAAVAAAAKAPPSWALGLPAAAPRPQGVAAKSSVGSPIPALEPWDPPLLMLLVGSSERLPALPLPRPRLLQKFRNGLSPLARRRLRPPSRPGIASCMLRSSTSRPSPALW
mmetsp:Transcript_3043/g.7367  ORF Transcript_3043/g.7367 Transcript_3043/m.7367 type:complete len:274 (+) Transcript_3043:169-990(+)